MSAQEPEKKDIAGAKTKASSNEKREGVYISPPPDPDVILQGGDDCVTATPISYLPFIDVGTTVGYTDDYDEECPYDAYNTPDVVYSFSPDHDGFIDITLCNDATDYDTKIYVYEDQCAPPYYACNEDACSTESFPDPYVSEILYLEVFTGHTYYIVIDGYSGEAGTYDLFVDWVTFEEIECPPEGIPEGEPDCYDDYDDQYNSGCGGYPEPVFSYINPGDIICGTSGTFLYQGLNMRDTDWYEYTTSASEELIWKAVAEFQTLIVILYGTDGCDSTEFLAYEIGNQYDTLEVSTLVNPGTFWMWIGPAVFEGYPCPVDYVAWFNTIPQGCEVDFVVDIEYEPYFHDYTTCAMNDDFNNTCLGEYDGGEDVMYQIIIPQTAAYTIELDPHGTACTGFLVDDICPPNVNECIDISTNSGSTPHGTTVFFDTGTYYIMVDTWPEPDCIPEYTLTIVDESYYPEGDLCEDPILITETFPFSDTNNTCDFYHDFCALTGNDDNADVIYELTLTTTHTLTISLCGSLYDTKLGIFADECCSGAGTELYYNDNFCDLQSEITGDFPSGVYYIVVDGHGSECGEYYLNITEENLCDYIPGDINGDGNVMGNDVTYGVRYFKGLGSQPPDSCWNNSTSSWLYSGGDTNGNCQFTGSDITFLVAFFKGYNPEILWCPQTPPVNPLLNIGKRSSR